MMRPVASVPPPADHGTITCTGRSGQPAACAGAICPSATAATAAQTPLTNDFNDASVRSEEHTSELQSLMRISYAVFCLKKKKKHHTKDGTTLRTTTHRT